MPDIRAVKRRVLDAKLTQLLKDYEGTMTQSASALDAVERHRLDRQAGELWTEIENLEQELKSLELAPPAAGVGTSAPDPVHVQRELHSKLPEIDFATVEAAIRKILKEYKKGGCAALLLFQRSAQMGGEWCAARVRELLRRETGSGLFRHIPLEFQPSEFADKMALLRRLGQELGLESEEQQADGFSQSVAEKVCRTLQSGNIFLVEYRRCDYLEDMPGFLRWLLENFWRVLVRELERAVSAKECSHVTVIVLLFVDATLPDQSLETEHFCTEDRFEKEKLLELALERWTQDDIADWIFRYSGLNLPVREAELMADTIFRATEEGLPTLVVHELLSRCTPSATG